MWELKITREVKYNSKLFDLGNCMKLCNEIRYYKRANWSRPAKLCNFNLFKGVLW